MGVERVKQRTPYPYDAVTKDFIRKKMTGLGLCETRVYLYISDHTRGYAKEWDAISWSQFCKGQKDRNGEDIDYGVGFKRTRVREAVETLWLLGLIRVIWRGTKANLYAVTHPSHIAEEAENAAREHAEWLATRPRYIGKHKPKHDPLCVAV
jgi:hypothetical protein